MAPKIYGLSKTHKPNISFRSIVNCIKAPSYKLAVQVHETLSNIVTTVGYNFKNFYEFVSYIPNMNIPEAYILASFDVPVISLSIISYIHKLTVPRWENQLT